MDSVHLGQAAHAPPVYRMVPPYNFESSTFRISSLRCPSALKQRQATGYRGCEGGATSEDQNALRWGQFRGSFLHEQAAPGTAWSRIARSLVEHQCQAAPKLTRWLTQIAAPPMN